MEIFNLVIQAIEHAESHEEAIGVFPSSRRDGKTFYFLYSQDEEALEEIAIRSGSKSSPRKLKVCEGLFILHLTGDAAESFEKEL